MKALALLLTLTAIAFAEAVKDREGAVRKDRATMENDARWIYGDFERGFAEAKRTGKPLLVTLRCVPCLSCAGIDASVLEDASLAPLHDQFICVRLIDANAIDLARFQFDYDLSFSTLFFNGDGTIYGRYGSWKHQRDPKEKTVDGYKRALEAALAVHRDYPANKAALAGKQGMAIPFKTPVEIPSLSIKYKVNLDWEGKVVGSCVHCHMVGEAIRTSYRDKGQAIPEMWVYPQPAPETLGLTLAPEQIAHVEAVAVGSIAALAGVQAGDDLVSVAGQPLVSVADVSWALHRAPDAGKIAAVVKRGGAERAVSLDLPAGWRSKSDISRRVGTWGMRGMALGGLKLEDLPPGMRKERGLSPDDLALFAAGVGQYGKHGAAKKAGFLKEDVIVEVGGMKKRATEGELIGWLIARHKAGEKVKTTVLRGDKRVELMLPIQ
ncbi:MAG: Trx7/PDZ domain-containing (seleno)protein [Chthoniobacteraceae bacterium]